MRVSQRPTENLNLLFFYSPHPVSFLWKPAFEEEALALLLLKGTLASRLGSRGPSGNHGDETMCAGCAFGRQSGRPGPGFLTSWVRRLWN